MTQEKKFLVSPGPHLWRNLSTSKIMYLVVAALMFPVGAAIYYFGYHALLIMAVSTATAVLAEYGVKKLRHGEFTMDGSAIVTGLIMALTLPPTIPWWMAAIGAAFAMAIAREAFGGLGHNIFNPALAGRAFLAACFSGEMSTWVLPMHFSVDAVTAATPLNESFVWHADKISLYKDLLLGNVGGSLGETSALLILIGGIMLLVLGIINWTIPVSYIGAAALLSFCLGQDALLQVLAGGLMLGAFFMATDYVTSPITNKGRIVFGVGAGILTVLIRCFGGMPEGVCFAILFMNALTPLIDRYIKPRPYGSQRKAAQ
ncbi:MAG: RnfABCDGE type electron transport complex subunit D [Dehalococcoidia bacterium]|nr:RnfABCDGE type electron transport complex subunit D [Dehalococcoidia bacterium]